MLPLGVQSIIVVSFPDQSSKKCYPLGGHTILRLYVWAGCAKGEGKRIACPLHFARAVHAKTHNQKGAGRPQRAAQQTAVHKGWSLQTGEPAEIAPRERPGSANGAPEIYDLLIRMMPDKMTDNACPHSAHCSTFM